LIVVLGLLAACETPSQRAAKADRSVHWPPITVPETGESQGAEIGAVEEAPAGEGGLPGPALYRGTDTYLAPGPPPKPTVQGDVILNFENIELREFVRSVLGETLRLNYVFDPRLEGVVTLQTTQPIGREAVLATVETVLRQNGAALVRDGEVYRVIPVDEAARGQAAPELAGGGAAIRPGYAILVMPLAYISAVQMATILEPMLPPEGIVRVDADRNLLVLAGTGQELRNLQEMARIFDVDWLKGMSAGLIPLANVEAKIAAEELQAIFGDLAQGPLAGMIRFVPVERLNALLVVAQRAEYLEQAETWIERLDRGIEGGERLFVYYVQNGKAKDLAAILNELFAKDSGERRAELRSEVAFGLEPVTVESAAAAFGQEPDTVAADELGLEEPAQDVTPEPLVPAAAALAGGGAIAVPGGGIRIIADEVNNALLVLATPEDYRMVQAALRKLDIVPLQVLVDATIADVILTDELRYGVQYFLSSGGHAVTLSNSRGSKASPVPTATVDGLLSAAFPGFAYTFATGDRSVQTVLEALDSVTDVNVISSPRILVLDNQTAKLQVGDEVPITTQQQQSTAADANVINNIQFRDTGVIVEVTPRVNAGGLVTLDIKQEVSNVSQTVDTGTLTPTIAQRKLESSIAIQSGDTVVLGGLISENRSKDRTGIPILSTLPMLGPLFGTQSEKITRSELIMLLTPRVIRNSSEAAAITEELKRRVDELQP
jgi:general secretion pathway protein D